MIPIHFDSEDVSLPDLNWESVASWITSTILSQEHELGDLSIVFCSDVFLHKLNLEHLQHDTLTDIITFDHTAGLVVSGELYISTDRVADNALSHGSTYNDELHRVMIHGVLHLLGYGDKSAEEQKQMRHLEDTYLALRSA